MIKRLIFFIVLMMLFTACVPTVPASSGPSATVAPTNPPATPLPPTSTSQPGSVESTPPPTHIPVDLTPAPRAAMQALMKDISVPVDQVKLVNTEEVQWPDGCLGVAIPGVMCTQVIVPGFRIILEANGAQYEYHTNQDGTSVVSAKNHLSGIQVVVKSVDGSIQIIDTGIALDPTAPPAVTGLLPLGGSVNGSAFVLNLGDRLVAQMADPDGTHPLDFVQNPNYSLAVWPGNGIRKPLLAWTTQSVSPTMKSDLFIAAPDGSQLETLLTEEFGVNQPYQLLAQRWSADGTSLYFSKEPDGIGGYIPFFGASSLYKIDIQSKQVTELIPFGTQGRGSVCLDAFSGDDRLVADHCAQNAITIQDMTSGQTKTIQPPAEVKEMRLVGSARFSPDNQRIAFAMAKRNPEAEQGWLAVSDGLSGASKLILTSQAGEYYTVAGWLDNKTLLVQVNGAQCNPTCSNSLWTVPIDGSNPVKVADGSFLTLIQK